MFGFMASKVKLPSAQTALRGRPTPIATADVHDITGRPLKGPWPAGMECVAVGMGCFWGAERLFWNLPGVYVTAVGYMGGYTPHPTYEEVCSGQTGHAEVVLIVFNPTMIPFSHILKLFWENHDPTQGMRQGNDTGTQYRSAIYTYSPLRYEEAIQSRAAFEVALENQGLGKITTTIAMAKEFYYAEAHHQQYLAKIPNGYCGLQGTGVACP